MFRKLYAWVKGLAATRQAPAALAVVSFVESSVFPIPPDVMLVPMVATRPNKAFVFATICTVASVLGGLLGYAIGLWLEPVALSILKAFGHPEGAAEFQKWFAQWGLYVILLKGLTPFPYKIVTISAGLAHFDLFTFIWSSVLTRGARFFVEAAILKRYGPAMMAEFEKRLNLYATLFIVLIVGGFVALKYLG